MYLNFFTSKKKKPKNNLITPLIRQCSGCSVFKYCLYSLQLYALVSNITISKSFFVVQNQFLIVGSTSIYLSYVDQLGREKKTQKTVTNACYIKKE